MRIKTASDGKKKLVLSKEEWNEIGRRGKWGPHAAGPGGCCHCPKCGKSIEHDRGVPCKSVKCPNCNVYMVRREEDLEKAEEEQKTSEACE